MKEYKGPKTHKYYRKHSLALTIYGLLIDLLLLNNVTIYILKDTQQCSTDGFSWEILDKKLYNQLIELSKSINNILVFETWEDFSKYIKSNDKENE